MSGLNLGDIKSPWLLYLKGALFVVLGATAAVLLWLERPTMQHAALLAITIWAFCRAYYFAFYVIQHYADPSYRFAGLLDFLKYLWRRRINSAAGTAGSNAPMSPTSSAPNPSPPSPDASP